MPGSGIKSGSSQADSSFPRIVSGQNPISDVEAKSSLAFRTFSFSNQLSDISNMLIAGDILGLIGILREASQLLSG